MTADAGQHWDSAAIPLGDRPALQNSSLRDVCLPTSGSGLVVGFGVSGNLALRSVDGGASWTDITTQVGDALPIQPRGVACVGTSELWIVGGGPTRVAHSIDGGATWTNETDRTPTDHTGELFDIAFIHESTGWISGGGPTILHTIDAGGTWLNEPLPFTSEGGVAIEVSFATVTTGAAVGLDETNITAQFAIGFATRDGGSTWARSMIPSEIARLRGISVVP